MSYYLKRGEDLEKEQSDRRRGVVESSFQNFLPLPAENVDNPVLEDGKENLISGCSPPASRGLKQPTSRQKSSNFISSLFLSPRQRQRKKEMKDIKKRERRKHLKEQEDSFPIPTVIASSAIIHVPLDESLSDIPSTHQTVSTESSSGVGKMLEEEFPSDSSRLATSIYANTAGKVNRRKSPSWRSKSNTSWRKNPIPEDRPSNHAIGIEELIEQLPTDQREVDTTCIVCNKDQNNSSTAIQYIDDSDWASLEWNALLPPSPNTTRPRGARRNRRASYSGGTNKSVKVTALLSPRTKSRQKMGRRLSCSGFPVASLLGNPPVSPRKNNPAPHLHVRADTLLSKE